MPAGVDNFHTNILKVKFTAAYLPFLTTEVGNFNFKFLGLSIKKNNSHINFP